MIPNRYNINNIYRTIRQPKVLLNEFSRLHNKYNKFRIGPGCEIIDEDWDNLILLDACRYDAFKQTNWIEGELDHRISQGSSSNEFILNNFNNKTLHDTIYISANPFVGLIDSDVFHAVITLLDEWDTDLQTVTPDVVTEASINAFNKFRDKRIIIHYMQPHQPYLGEKAKYIRKEIGKKGQQKGFDNKIRKSTDDQTSLEGVKQLEAPKYNNIDVGRDDVWEAYYETLELVLEHVEELITRLNGKTVISSDHGELIGEPRYIFDTGTFGHPEENWSTELRMVPWFEPEASERRKIKDEPPVRYDQVNQKSLNKKLEALGYM